jgi:hypothetical protein
MLHGRHDRKIEGASAPRHPVDPMRLARVQQNNWNKRDVRLKRFPSEARGENASKNLYSSAATLSKNE